jgi:hypothetical protein
MAVKVVMLPGVGYVTLSRNGRSRGMKLSVRPGFKILVSFPPGVSYTEAADFALQHKDWIIGQQNKLQMNASPWKPEFPMKTKFHTVNIQPDGEKFSVKQKKFEINIFFPSIFSSDSEQVTGYVGKVLDMIYLWEAKHYLPSRLAQLAGLHGFRYGRVSFRKNRSNWGSCSSKGNISLNIKLMKLPDHLIDFVLLHELVHTRIRNHGPEFKAMLDQLSGGRMKQLSAEIRKYSLVAYS